MINVHVANNHYVQQGDVLYELDPRPFQYEVDRLAALLVQTKYQIKMLQSELAARREELRQHQADLAFNENNYQRYIALIADNLVAQQKLDQTIDAVKTSKALVLESQANIQQLEDQLAAMIDGDHATVQQVRAELANALLELSETVITAPVDGLVSNMQLTAGSYVESGTPVLTLIDSSHWWIVANFRENALSAIEPGQSIEFALLMYPAHIFYGRVDSVGWGIEQGQGIPSGMLPLINNPTAWITPSQRFQVNIAIESWQSDRPLRVGASTRGWY